MSQNDFSCTGRFTADPELRYVGDERHEMVAFTLAVDRDEKNEDGSRTADFPDFVAWRDAAKFICRNFHKGDQITVVNARVKTRNFTVNDGSTRHKVEFEVPSARNIYFGSRRRDRQDGSSQDTDC